ncbi:MAG: hypothetical protein RLZZ56_130 [Actinomycetota bacterium]|jgi:exodeoxyribonuclease VII small subunit
MTEKNNEDIAKLSYEQARDELVKVLSDLEAGTVSLEQSMTLWERGEALAKHCKSLLSGAKAKIDEALKDK